MSRRRRARTIASHPAETIRRDPLARWRSFSHRGMTIEFVPSGMIVEARTPDELAEATDAEVLIRTKDEPGN